MKKVVAGGVVLLLLILGLFIFGPRTDAPGIQSQQTPLSPPPSSSEPSQFNKNQFSTDTAGSIWWVVNKKRPLQSDYIPPDLAVPAVPLRLAASSEQMQISQQIVEPLQSLFAAVKQAGFELQLDSGYRSYAYQQQLYNSYVAKDGQAAADTYSARPGTSEHQTGLALDVDTTDGKCQLDKCFGQTPAGQWLAAHAHEHGFIIRYPEGKEATTGYQYEPWHLRYVGKDLATELTRTNKTMEEFFFL